MSNCLKNSLEKDLENIVSPEQTFANFHTKIHRCLELCFSMRVRLEFRENKLSKSRNTRVLTPFSINFHQPSISPCSTSFIVTRFYCLYHQGFQCTRVRNWTQERTLPINKHNKRSRWKFASPTLVSRLDESSLAEQACIINASLIMEVVNPRLAQGGRVVNAQFLFIAHNGHWIIAWRSRGAGRKRKKKGRETSKDVNWIASKPNVWFHIIVL